jgi:hypothetical protein
MGPPAPHSSGDERLGCENLGEETMEADDRPFQHLDLPVSSGTVPMPVDPPPWIASLFGLDAEGVFRVLDKSLAQIEDPTLRRFRDAVLRHTPFALAYDAEHWYIGMRWEKRTIYLEPPPDFASLERVLAEYGFSEFEVIREFYFHFYGLRGCLWEFCPLFIHPADWERFESYGWREQLENFGCDRRWERAVIIYSVGNGDMILLDPIEGDAAWALLSTCPPMGPIVPIAPSFKVLIDTFSATKERECVLLDYYRWLEMRDS